MLGWIRSGDGIHNAYVVLGFRRFPTFVGVSVVCVLIVSFEALVAEDHIALVALERMDNDVFADNAL